MKYILYLTLFVFCLLACQNKNEKQAEEILEKWINKEIVFPENLHFSVKGKVVSDFSIQDSEYKIVVYVDSTGCTSCKLHLSEWKNYINYIDSIQPNKIQFLFFFFPKNGRDIYLTLRIENFMYPVCIDTLDVLNKLNNFPSDMKFQTYLLNKNNRVLAVGNPMQNPKIKELYLNIISEKYNQPLSGNQPLTTLSISRNQIDMGRFSWEKEQKVEIEVSNTGKMPLVISDVITSCGCIKTEYMKKTINPGKNSILRIKYKAEYPEYFDKTITVYCNAESSPFEVRVKGNAR